MEILSKHELEVAREDQEARFCQHSENQFWTDFSEAMRMSPQEIDLMLIRLNAKDEVNCSRFEDSEEFKTCVRELNNIREAKNRWA